MTTAKVSLSFDIEKLKAEKALTSEKCCVDECQNVGRWINERKSFRLTKGMCNVHYLRFTRYGDVSKVLHIKGNQTKHPLYNTLSKIKSRIFNKDSVNFSNYGGRGLKMEMRWCEPVVFFQNFLEDIAHLGECPAGYSLDRIDNNKGYFADNLRWASNHQQGANQRTNNENVGVHYCKTNKRWVAQLGVNKKHYSKSFRTQAEAIAQREEWNLEFGILN